MIRVLAVILAVSAVAACTSSPAQSPAAVAARAASPLQDVPEAGLPAQRLAPGECGLFLWSMTPPQKFVFFTRAASGRAELWHESRAVTLTQVDAHGDIFGQFLTASDYVSPDAALEVSLTFRPGETLEQGQRVEGGRVVIRGRDGWETVLPVSGISACMGR
ncbi:hypothetical protein [Hyphomonas sp.]|uniref:hypothetical protein n=1 Tax=Hyphomonas sp. TaxID=87 RepID=UPI00391BE741